MDIVSLFAGCGGLDLGFKLSGFNIVWANEYDSTIWKTFENNFPGICLDKRSITEIDPSEIPDCVGIIGGPPCQSWSEAGSQRGLEDHRGQLFFDYVRVLKEKQPLFFLAENVSGILAPKHTEAFSSILESLSSAGYNVSYKLLNAKNFNVPQDRKRVIIVGFHESLNAYFEFPKENSDCPTLRGAIWGMPEPLPARHNNKANPDNALKLPNHEYMNGGFSTIYMSRNRVRSWNEQSFTIQAGGRHAPCHPQANKMIFIEQDKRIFDPRTPKPYRRLSVRECARVQTFPDSFLFDYENIADGYKMIGNAVPVNFAKALGSSIYAQLLELKGGIKLVQESNIPKVSKKELAMQV